VRSCPNCLEENPDKAKFCLNCGSSLAGEDAAEERKVVTIVFADLVGFTRQSDHADPEDVKAMLRPFHARLKQEIERFGGTVDKFIGDAVMVFWNAPNPQADHVARACRAVLAAKAAGERLNVEFEADALKPFITRFGIHVGEAVVGNVGSTERMNYTALGNTVNLAARLEGLNKQTGTTILVSEDVYRRVADLFEFRALDAVVAKGMTKETRIFELRGVST
jgi:adenylate cyclase